MTTQSGRLQSLALAVVLAIGAGIVWLFIVRFGLGVIPDAFVNRSSVSKQLVVLRNGTPVVEVYQGQDKSYHSIDGKRLDLVNVHNPTKCIYGVFIRGPRPPAWVGGSWSRRITHLGIPSSRESYGSVNWYFVHDGARGHGYFIGYDRVTKLKVGCLGRNGFRPDKPTAEEQFPVNGHNLPLEAAQTICHLFNPVPQPGIASKSDRVYLITREGLVPIDLNARTVNTVRHDAGLVSVVASGFGMLARTPNRILALDRDGKEIDAYYSLPAELRNAELQWYQISDKALVHASMDAKDLFWLDAAGRIVRRERVDLHGASREPTIVAQMADLLDIPSPGVIVAFFAGVLWEVPRDDAVSYSVALGRALREVLPRLLSGSVISIFLAAFCYCRQRKYGLPWTWVWTGFVLLFGLPAYVGYLAHRAWPARLPCPHCGRLVPRDRPACFACGHDFPPPAMKGIEVFA